MAAAADYRSHRSGPLSPLARDPALTAPAPAARPGRAGGEPRPPGRERERVGHERGRRPAAPGHDRWQPGGAVRPADRGRRRRDPHLRPPRRLLRTTAATGRNGRARPVRAAGVRLLGGSGPLGHHAGRIPDRRRLDGRPARLRGSCAPAPRPPRAHDDVGPLRRRADGARQRARRAAPELRRERVAALDHAPGPPARRDPPGRDRRAGRRRRRCADGALDRRPLVPGRPRQLRRQSRGRLRARRDVVGRPARRGRGPSPRAPARHRRPTRRARGARLLRRAPRLRRSTARRAALVARRDDDRVDRRRRHPRVTRTGRGRPRRLRPRAATRSARRHGRRVDRGRRRAPGREPGRSRRAPSSRRARSGS